MLCEEVCFLKDESTRLKTILLGACLVVYNARNLLQRTGGKPESFLLSERKCQRLYWKFSTKKNIFFFLIIQCKWFSLVMLEISVDCTAIFF